MAGFPISMRLLGTGHPEIGFWVCIGLTTCMGLFNSLLMNAGFALMSIAPEKSATFFLLGQTTTSVIAWPIILVLRIIVRATGATEHETNYMVAIITLSFAAIFCLGTIPLYFLKTKFHPVFRHLLLNPAHDQPLEQQADSMVDVFKKVFAPVMCGWSASVITFCVYPSQAGIWIPSMTDPPFTDEVYQSFMMYMFSVSDTVGRAVPRWIKRLQQISNRQFITATLLRGVVFIPLFLLSTHHIWFVLSSDTFRLVMVLLFGLSNGINFNLSNMLAPPLVEEEDKMNVGTLLSFGAINGLFVGSLIAIGLVQI
jgi:hypothetical protein